MALSNSEANAVNTIARYFLSIPSLAGHVSDGQAIAALQLLREKAYKTLMAGLTEHEVLAAFSARVADLDRRRGERAERARTKNALEAFGKAQRPLAAEVERLRAELATSQAVVEAASAVVAVWRQWGRRIHGSPEEPPVIPIRALALTVDALTSKPAADIVFTPPEPGDTPGQRVPEDDLPPPIGDPTAVGASRPGSNETGPGVGACASCDGTRWVDDEGWQPEDYERARKPLRRPGSGRIPCGACNLGGWNADDGAEDTGADAEDGGAGLSFMVAGYGSHMATRELGRRIRESLIEQIATRPFVSSLIVDFTRVEAMTVAFTDELLGALFAAWPRNLATEAVLVIGLNDATHESVVTALSRRGIDCVQGNDLGLRIVAPWVAVECVAASGAGQAGGEA